MEVAPAAPGTSDLVNEHGARFGDTIVLHTQVGRGCSACVYIARDAHGNQAACKLARLQPGMKWQRVVRTFQREALLVQRCVHPHIIGYHGLYLSRTEAALVLSLAPGGDCQQLLMRHGALAESVARGIVSQLCDALDCLHRTHRMLHRDVKLENLLVKEISGRSGVPHIKLCDFGHSCLLDQPLHGTSVDDGFKGTEGYAAPEVAAGGLWSPAADVWSVGVVVPMVLQLTPTLQPSPISRPLPLSRPLTQPHPCDRKEHKGDASTFTDVLAQWQQLRRKLPRKVDLLPLFP